MKSARAISDVITGVSFSFYTPEDVRKLSVKQITNPVTYDELQNPVEGGLYDLALGPVDRKQGACVPLPSSPREISACTCNSRPRSRKYYNFY